MNDLTQIENARKRLLSDPALPARLAANLRQDCAVARRAHPLGYSALDGELRSGMAALCKLAGAEQLLAVERLAAHFDTRRAEAEAEERRQSKAAWQARFEQDLARQREAMRAAWANSTNKDIRVAFALLQERLARLSERLAAMGNEIEFREILSDAADALSAMRATLGLEQRASISRSDQSNKNDKDAAAAA